MIDFLPVPTARPLGRSGITLPPLAWGHWRLAGSVADATALSHAALDAGLVLFDTADIYGFTGESGFGDAEALFGEVMAVDPALRGRIILATKGGIMPPLPYDQSRAYLNAALDASLKRLRVDHVDLYQVHRPDILTHPAELAETLDAMVASGKVRAVGVSNMTTAQIEALAHFMKTPLASTQPEISPLRLTCFENGELDQAMRHGLSVLAWSPLGGGRIADPGTAREQAVAAALDAVATAQGVSRTAATYSWLMAHPAGIIPIVGSQQAGRIVEAADALKVRWTRTDWYAVLVAARGEKLP
jgi:predicted oxidoreductase